MKPEAPLDLTRADIMLTREQLAERLQVKPKTITRETVRGHLRVHYIGRLPRYIWSEVVEDTRAPSVQERLRQALLPSGLSQGRRHKRPV